MTRVFTDEGMAVPVTVIEVLPNRVTRVLTADQGGYSAVQVTTGQKKPSRLAKPASGNFAGVEPGDGLWEFRLEPGDTQELKPGVEFKVDLFKPGQFVDVSGTSMGKGYAGAVKRHNFSTQDATHGNSLSHRAPGSIGQRQFPGRVFPGNLAGHMGDERQTMQNLEVVRVDTDRNLIMVKGSVPGVRNGRLVVKPAVKAGKSTGVSE
jgi:large subunit ribosomal protein L3